MRSRFRENRAAAVTLGAAFQTACAGYMAAPPMADMPRIPTADELWRMQQEKGGKAPIAEPAAAGGIQVVFQTGHAGMISSVAMSADGRYILSSSWDETAKLWDVASGQELRTITGLGMTGGHVAFVSGTERLAINDMTGGRLIDLTTGQTVRELGEFGQSAAISANGRYAAMRVVEDDGGRRRLKLAQTSVLNVVDLASDQVFAMLPIRGQAEPLAVSDDALLVAVRRMDDIGAWRAAAEPQWRTEVWDVAAKKMRSQFLSGGGSDEGLSHALSPDGRLLALSSLGKIRLYSTADGSQQLELTTSSALAMGSVMFSPDGRRLASFVYTGDPSRPGARIWDIPGGSEVASFDASALGFSADGRTLVVGRQSGGAPVLRDLETGRESSLAGGASAVVDLAAIGDGSSVAAATELGGVRHWDLRTGQLLRTFDCPGGTGTRSVSASTAGPWLAASCNDGGVYVWNLQTGALMRTLNPPAPGKFGVSAIVRFDPSGRRIAFSVNEQLALWDMPEGRELRRITLPRGRSLLAPSTVQAGLPEEALREYEERLEQSGMTEELQHGVRALAFHPGGRFLAVAKTDPPTLLVDIESGEIARRFTGGDLTQPAPSPQADPSAQSAMMQQLLGGRGLSRRQKKVLEQAMGSAGVESGGDPVATAMIRSQGDIGDVLDEFDSVVSLAFSADGGRLFTLGLRGKRAWDVETGSPIEQPRAATAAGIDPAALLESGGGAAVMENAIKDALDTSVAAVRSSGLAVTADGRLAARGHGNLVKLWDVASDQEIADLAGHTSDVTSVVYAANARLLVSGSRDGTLRVWNVPGRTGVVQLIALGASDYVAVTPDQYYRASKRRITGVAFRANDKLYPFEQFDLRFNRPDFVLERLGGTPPDVVQSYRAAYQRRLKKMGFTEEMLSREFHLPEVALVGATAPVTTNAASLTLRVRASDAEYALDRINVFVNDVPVYGTAGLRIPEPQLHVHEQDVEVPLVPGRNKVQVSVLNAQGAESLRQTAYTTSTADPGNPDVYLLAIGVSRYRNDAYNLRFAAKDAADLVDAYRASAGHGTVHVLDLTNEKATRESIRQAKAWLGQARVNDLVVVFAAGHGMTDARQNYYFGTHDIDPERPELNGLPYEDFEALLDGIRAMRKVLLIDTCFSGEIEKDEAIIVAQAQTGGEGTVSMRAFKAARGISIAADDAAAGSAPALAGEVLRFQQELFADLRRGTGAVVISSASGNEYALEGEQWSNGVFTYALLDGLKNARADANQDRTITVSELQAHVIDEVRRLTAGGQNPTVRRENLDYDFVVY